MNRAAVPWLMPEVDDPVDLTQASVQMRSGLDWNLHSWVSYRQRGVLTDHPEYQREFIREFSEDFKTPLVESALCNAPIPSVYLCEREGNRFEVLDGQQRVRTLLDFIENAWSLVGKYLDPAKWTAAQIESLDGRHYRELPAPMQDKLSLYVLRAESFKETREWAAVDIYHRVNKSTADLNQMEQEKARYHASDQWSSLYRFSNEEPWKTLIKGPLDRARADQRNIRYQCLAELVHHLIFADLAASERLELQEPYSGSKGRLISQKLREICAARGGYGVDSALRRVRKWMQTSVEVMGKRPFQLMRLNESGHPGGDIASSRLFAPHFQLLSYVLARAIHSHGAPTVVRLGPRIRERFHEFVNDTARVEQSSARSARMPMRQHFIEDRATSLTKFHARIRWLWPEIESILATGTAARDPRRAFPDQVLGELWASSDLHLCSFCNQPIVAPGHASPDHRLPWAEGGASTVENARLAHRTCNFADGQRLALDRRREAEQALMWRAL